ncbi:hypothetical protein [Streptomyces sp. NPDC002853]
MRYDQQRAQQPASAPAQSAKQHDPQAPPRASRQTGTLADTGQTSPPTLITQGERDKMTVRLQHALSTFVENPHQAVQEADNVFEEAASRLTDVLAERRHMLRTSWQDRDAGTRTEELRLALREYEETTERLLRI